MLALRHSMLALRHIGAAAIAVAFALAAAAIDSAEARRGGGGGGGMRGGGGFSGGSGSVVAECVPARLVAASSPAGHIPRIRSQAPA